MIASTNDAAKIDVPAKFLLSKMAPISGMAPSVSPKGNWM